MNDSTTISATLDRLVNIAAEQGFDPRAARDTITAWLDFHDIVPDRSYRYTLDDAHQDVLADYVARNAYRPGLAATKMRQRWLAIRAAAIMESWGPEPDDVAKQIAPNGDDRTTVEYPLGWVRHELAVSLQVIAVEAAMDGVVLDGVRVEYPTAVVGALNDLYGTMVIDAERSPF